MSHLGRRTGPTQAEAFSHAEKDVNVAKYTAEPFLTRSTTEYRNISKGVHALVGLWKRVLLATIAT